MIGHDFESRTVTRGHYAGGGATTIVICKRCGMSRPYAQFAGAACGPPGTPRAELVCRLSRIGEIFERAAVRGGREVPVLSPLSDQEISEIRQLATEGWTP